MRVADTMTSIAPLNQCCVRKNVPREKVRSRYTRSMRLCSPFGEQSPHPRDTHHESAGRSERGCAFFVMTTRRDFLRTSTGAAVAMIGAPSIILRSRAGADIIIRNGTVFDGLGTAGRELDVLVANGKIVSLVKRSSERGTVEIDARGMAVAPGFIDIHSHGDGSLWEDPRSESLIRQGITTIRP